MSRVQVGSDPLASAGHAVVFWDRAAQLTDAVSAYVAAGLARGEPAVLVTTPTHLVDIEASLRTSGIDPDAARQEHRYLTADAGSTLAQLMPDGRLDRSAFDATVAELIDGLDLAKGSRVRAFGEMVALLWERGDLTGAILLEEWWEDLLTKGGLRLLCGYPTSVMDGALGDVARICERHGTLHPPSGNIGVEVASPDAGAAYGPPSQQRSAVFVPVAQSVRAARRFVSEALTEWGAPDLIWGAGLAASEMATNAVIHARSPFRAYVHVHDDMAVVAVKDTSPVRVAPVGVPSTDPGGRGLTIVTHLADRWGCDVLPDGKLVWAEFSARSATT